MGPHFQIILIMMEVDTRHPSLGDSMPGKCTFVLGLDPESFVRLEGQEIGGDVSGFGSKYLRSLTLVQ